MMSLKQPNRAVYRKHEKIREAYEKRYTKAPRPRKYTKEYIIAKLAEEFYLSMRQIENIVYTKPSTEAAAAVASECIIVAASAAPLSLAA